MSQMIGPEPLIDAILNVDRPAAALLMEHALQNGVSPQRYMAEVLDPALAYLGDLWGKKEVSLAQAFVGAKIAEDVLTRCIPLENSNSPRGSKGVVVLGNIEDDFHSLGRNMVVAFLRAAGWLVHDLGNDVPAEVFLEQALQHNAAIIGASAMMQTTALNIRRVRELIDSQGLQGKLRLAVGGAVFNWRPDLVKEVGGDGTAANAASVDALFTRLIGTLPERKTI